jgi:hypothetical protein
MFNITKKAGLVILTVALVKSLSAQYNQLIVIVPNATIRMAPDSTSTIMVTPDRNDLLKMTGHIQNWFLVEIPDTEEDESIVGYILKSQVDQYLKISARQSQGEPLAFGTKKTPFFNNVAIGVKYDFVFGGMGLYVQAYTKYPLAFNFIVGHIKNPSKVLIELGLKYYHPREYGKFRLFNELHYGPINSHTTKTTMYDPGGPIYDYWGRLIRIAEERTSIIVRKNIMQGPGFSTGVEYTINRRYKIIVDAGLSYATSGLVDGAPKIHPIINIGFFNNYW